MKKLYLILILCFWNFLANAQLSRHQLVRVINISDLNELNAIANPHSGSLAFVVSDQRLYQYDGVIWRASTDDWKLTGNSSANNDFIGGINNADFEFKTNSIERMVIKADGKVGLGNTVSGDLNPTGIFQVLSPVTVDNRESVGHLDLAGLPEFYQNGNFTVPILFTDGNELFAFDGNLTTNFNLDFANYVNNNFHGANLQVEYNTPKSFWGFKIISESGKNPTSITVFARNGTGNLTQIFDYSESCYWNWDEYSADFANLQTYDTFIFFFQSRACDNSGELTNEVRLYEIQFFEEQENNVGVDGTVFIVSTNGNVGVATDNPSQKLEVNGSILASSFITPDYVFDTYYEGSSQSNTNYKFKSLPEVKKYIKSKHHLPGVPSAKDIKQQGGIILNNAVEYNLEKIEELYLHLFELNESIKAIKEDVQQLKQ